MNKEIKPKWLDALRSGKYKQSIHKLRNPSNGFCCIGVLCDVVAPDRWHKVDDNYLHDGCKAYASTVVYNATDLTNEVVEKLVHMNDRERRTFAEIADWIEENE